MELSQTLEESLLSANGVWEYVEAAPLEPGHAHPVTRFSREDACTAEFRFRSFQLNAFERTAIQALDSHESAIVSAPTAIGKTILAAYYIAEKYSASIRVFYLVPIKALADEIFCFLKSVFGCSVGYSHGGGQVNRHAPILIMTYEKFEVLSLSEEIEHAFIVIDEFHFILQSPRGSVIERILIFLKGENQFLCMSATISELSQLGSWTGFRVIYFADDFRPFTVEEISLSGPRGLDIALHDIRARNENCLVFCQSRARVRSLANEYAASVLPDSANPQYSSVEDTELKHCLEGGTAFHSAGLTHGDEKIAEEAFREGRIPLLFCTTTLAYGVNLDACNVILSRTANEPEFDACDATEISGRAGRRALGRAYFTDAVAELTYSSRILDDLLKTAEIAALKGQELEEVLRKSYCLHCWEIQNIDLLCQNAEALLEKYNILTNQAQITQFGRAITKIYQPVEDIVKIAEAMKKILPRPGSVYTLLEAAVSPLNDEHRSMISEIGLNPTNPAEELLYLMKRKEVGNLEALSSVFEDFAQNAPRVAALALEVALEANDGVWAAILARECVLLQNRVADELQLAPSILQNGKLSRTLAELGGNSAKLVAQHPEWASAIEQAKQTEFEVQLQTIFADSFELKIAAAHIPARAFVSAGPSLLLSEHLDEGVNTLSLEINSARHPQICVYIAFQTGFERHSYNIEETKRPIRRDKSGERFTDIRIILAKAEETLKSGGKVAILGSESTTNSARASLETFGRVVEVAEIAKNHLTELDLAKGNIRFVLGAPFVTSDDFAELGFTVFIENGVACNHPLESCLDLHFGACIPPGTMRIEDFMDLIGSSLLAYRLLYNPSYYGLKVPFQIDRNQLVTEEMIGDFVSKVLEDEIADDPSLDFDGENITRR